uniref:uncharacterized protein LOC120339988 n=1 Tax=Styela clava TaxID=7725 RepID=UPI00193A8F8B|nr:uncharacterized protein LOC120339988 [Styela clava]
MKCTNMCRSSEMADEQMKKIEKTEDYEEIETFYKEKKAKHGYKQRRRSMTGNNTANITCKYCGRIHKKGTRFCPAYGVLCNACHKKNHFAVVCKQTNRKLYSANKYVNKSSDSAYNFETIGSIQSRGVCWFVNLKLHAKGGRKPVLFKCMLDSGSTSNVISFNGCKVLGTKNPASQESSVTLKFYDGSLLKPIGQCNFLCQHNGKNYMLSFIVVERGPHPLLSAQTCES